MKVHGISDKVMGLSSPKTLFFISLEPVKVLSAFLMAERGIVRVKILDIVSQF